MATANQQSDLKVIRDFFGFRRGDKLRDFGKEYQALTAEDKTQLAEGIRNKTFTY